MPKGKKQANYIVMVTQSNTQNRYFLESISYAKGTYKLVPLKDIDKAKTYAAADTVQKDIHFINRFDYGVVCLYDTPDNWKMYFAQRGIEI